MSVYLRQRSKGNKVSLYLDYYQAGKRQYEYLKLYLHPVSPGAKLTARQREENKQTLALAEAIRSKRHLESQISFHGFPSHGKVKESFVLYMERLAEKRKSSKGNYDNWESAVKHLKKFAPHGVVFGQLTKEWMEGFKAYLLSEARTPGNKGLSQNSAHSYYNKLRAALREAHKDRIISVNPATLVDGIKAGNPQREFLTIEEVKALVQTECEIPVLKRAFLFGVLTGLRWSDINMLQWSDVFYSEGIGHYIRYVQKKTKGAETLPVSDEAVLLMGIRGSTTDRVFKGLKYSAWHNLKLQQWVMRAGVTKHITFHSSRHTQATLQLLAGTDIYTIMSLLGQKYVTTTQVYAHVIDKKKSEAVRKISIGLTDDKKIFT